MLDQSPKLHIQINIFFKIFNYFESSWLKPIFNECSDVATTMMHESIVLQFSIE